MRIMINRNAYGGKLILFLIAWVVLAGLRPGIAGDDDQEEWRQLRAMMDSLSQQDLEKMWTEARQGNAGTQFLLGFMYEKGLRVPMDLTEAVKWYRLAANQVNAEAQNNLAILCLQSNMDGLQREVEALARGGFSLRKRGWLGCDAAEAYAWLILSAAQGNKNAAKNKALFKRQGLLTEFVVEGQRLADELLERIEAAKTDVESE